tara:strand:- start:4 stop:186 length:183 start_codon:yes stop_codon:yes gene_type:complete
MSINYTRDWEELEESTYEEVVKTKKKPKRKKKSWKELNTIEKNKRNKKTGKLWTNNPNRV